MKYLEGSSFAVRVGGSAYAEGWDRVFGQGGAESLEVAARTTIPCRNGRHETCVKYREWLKVDQACSCECHG